MGCSLGKINVDMQDKSEKEKERQNSPWECPELLVQRVLSIFPQRLRGAESLSFLGARRVT